MPNTYIFPEVPLTKAEQEQAKRQQKLKLMQMLEICIDYANQFGFVVTVETAPNLPLRMGNYEMVFNVREKHAN
jgi:hypothetical protein